MYVPIYAKNTLKYFTIRWSDYKKPICIKYNFQKVLQ